MSTFNIDDSVVKRPNNDAPLTEEQLEMWLRYADDPDAFFVEQCYVRGQRGKMLFEPRDYQKDMMDSIRDNTHNVIVAPRQIGKCVSGDTRINVKINGVEQLITISQLHALMKSQACGE